MATESSSLGTVSYAYDAFGQQAVAGTDNGVDAVEQHLSRLTGGDPVESAEQGMLNRLRSFPRGSLNPRPMASGSTRTKCESLSLIARLVI